MPHLESPHVHRARRCITVAMLAGLAACATVEDRPCHTCDAPREGLLALTPAPRPRVALVLSGGSARGFAHVGVIRVLQAQGVEPDIVVGSSAGAIVAVAWASGLNALQLTEATRALEMSTFADFTLPDLGLPVLGGERGWVRGERLRRWIDQVTGGRPLEALPRRVAVVATDLQSGRPVAFTHGSAGLAVQASAAVPGVFVPPLIGGRHYVDGQVSSPVPVTLARSLGADVVIAVDATFPPEHAEIAHTVGVLFQAFTIATQRVKMHELAQADLVITPQIRTASQLGLADREWLMRAGEDAAQVALPGLRRLLAPGHGP